MKKITPTLNVAAKHVTRNTAVMCLASLLLSACTSVSTLLPTDPRAASNVQPENFQNVQLIGVDLVNALMQVPGKHPQNTVITMDTPKSTFATALKQVLENSGYGLRIDSDQNEGDTLNYVIEPKDQESDGRHYTYMISVGEVKMKRDYFVQQQGVTPSSNLYVIGTDPTAIALNDDIFEAPPEPLNTDGVVISKTTESRILTPPVRVDEDTDSPDLFAGPIKAEPDKKRPTDLANMYETRESNYTEYLVDYSDVHQEVLIFPNDSMRLGESNKNRIESIADSLSLDSDVVSVIGCSHGRTAIENGNERLAKGRAQRVLEAFTFAGIDADRVFEEGCWAPTYFDEVMPRRGVVVTVKRLKNAT